MIQGRVEADSLRAVLDSVFANPRYDWTPRVNPLAFLTNWWNWLREQLFHLQDTQPTLFNVLFWILVLILVLIFAHALWVLLRTLQAAREPGLPDAAPGPERRGSSWYRREAQRLAREGRFPDAMQADFLGLVLELDQRRLLKFHPSKTPNEYTYEVKLAEQGREDFRDLVRSLYRFAFARQPCGPEEFRDWQLRTTADRYAPAH